LQEGNEKILAENEAIKRVKEKAYEYDKYSSCSQSVLLAIQEEFSIGNKESLKAATALAGGVARQGETCGALIGAIMALGLVIGREKIENIEQYYRTVEYGIELCKRFKAELKRQLGFSQELKSASCREIQERVFGKSFNLADREDYQAYLDACAKNPAGSPMVQAVGAQVAAEIILELKQDRRKRG